MNHLLRFKTRPKERDTGKGNTQDVSHNLAEKVFFTLLFLFYVLSHKLKNRLSLQNEKKVIRNYFFEELLTKILHITMCSEVY